MTISKDVRKLVLRARGQRMTQQQIRQVYNVSPRAQSRIAQLARTNNGNVTPPRKRTKVYSYIVRNHHYFMLLGILIQCPTLYYREMRVQLFQRCRRLYTSRQLRDVLRARNITRKKIQRMANERDEALRAHFRDVVLPRFTAPQLVSVDEFSRKAEQVNRSYGYAPKRERAIDRKAARGRKLAVSSIGAMSLRGPMVNTCFCCLFCMFDLFHFFSPIATCITAVCASFSSFFFLHSPSLLSM